MGYASRNDGARRDAGMGANLPFAVSKPDDHSTVYGPAHLSIAIAWVKARRQRETAFGAKLFQDPAWDILLDLYINQHSGRRTSVTDLFHSGPSSPTTILRWLAILEQRGLVSRLSDPHDRRRNYIALTAPGVEKMERALHLAATDGTAIASKDLRIASSP